MLGFMDPLQIQRHVKSNRKKPKDQSLTYSVIVAALILLTVVGLAVSPLVTVVALIPLAVIGLAVFSWRY